MKKRKRRLLGQQLSRAARMRLKTGQGLPKRIQGHLRAKGKRRQAKRDRKHA